MKTLYIECKMGAAGDMLMAALYELLTETGKKEFLDTMNGLFGGDITLSPEKGTRCSISGTLMHVETSCGAELSDGSHSPSGRLHSPKDAHAHYSYPMLLEKIKTLAIPDSVKKNASGIYRLLGEAEARVHGCALEQIHFHEVGSLDAVADVVGNCLLFAMLHADVVCASPIHVGNGTVRCAHGILPVPAPATAELLKGIPYYCGDICAELCTPTGAAILKYFSSEFIPMPVMTTEAVGTGLGAKEFPAANCVRVFYGNTDIREPDAILELSCNLDDMTGEELGFAMETLLVSGAYDVFYESIYMKKNRPGILLTCFCPPSEKDRFTELIFKHTTTRGVRYQSLSRARLSARFEERKTEYGIVRNKISEGYGVTRSKFEYDDLRHIAKETGLSIREVRESLTRPRS